MANKLEYETAVAKFTIWNALDTTNTWLDLLKPSAKPNGRMAQFIATRRIRNP